MSNTRVHHLDHVYANEPADGWDRFHDRASQTLDAATDVLYYWDYVSAFFQWVFDAVAWCVHIVLEGIGWLFQLLSFFWI